MLKRDLPAYAIVELLMRLSHHNKLIGDYKNHAVTNNDVIVKTSTGSITFTRKLIMQQFEDPELISNDALSVIASSFRALRNQKLFTDKSLFNTWYQNRLK